MWIIRTLTAAGLLLGFVLPAPAQASENDSHCVTERNNRLHNKCSYPVDVGFCVTNPQQTKNFFDGSDAFQCPNGGLSTLRPGKSEGNILHGTVHWFACNTKYRGKDRWNFVEGSGYRGYCYAENEVKAEVQTSPSRTNRRASEQECHALARQVRSYDKPGDPDANRLHYFTLVEMNKRGCTDLPPKEQAEYTKYLREILSARIAECKKAGRENCAVPPTFNVDVNGASPRQAIAETGSNPPLKSHARAPRSVESLISSCTREIQATSEAFYSAQEVANRVFRQTGGMPLSSWQNNTMDNARHQALNVLKRSPDQLRQDYKGLLEEAASRANGFTNDRSRHDPHYENALMGACLVKAALG